MSVCPLISHAMSVPVFTCNDRLHGGGGQRDSPCATMKFLLPKCNNNIFITDITSFLQLSAHIRLVI